MAPDKVVWIPVRTFTSRAAEYHVTFDGIERALARLKSRTPYERREESVIMAAVSMARLSWTVPRLLAIL